MGVVRVAMTVLHSDGHNNSFMSAYVTFDFVCAVYDTIHILIHILYRVGLESSMYVCVCV